MRTYVINGIKVIHNAFSQCLLKFSVVIVTLVITYTAACSESNQRILQKYKEIAGTSRIDSISETQATYYQDNVGWTIYGAIQSPNSDLSLSARSNAPSPRTKILLVKEPISDLHIGPFADPLPNTEEGNTLKMVVTPGEYEPTSFVIHTGDEEFEHTTISVSPLRLKGQRESIPAENIDIRIVKSWFQSSENAMRRTNPRSSKRLVPELLLHDNELVRTDYEHQVNIVRSHPVLTDSDQLKPFNIPRHFNQQVWISVKTPDTLQPGVYNGKITIRARKNRTEVFTTTMTLRCKVLPFRLEEPNKYIGVFYLARLHSPGRTSYVSRGKNRQQMYEEFKDMLEHGVNILALDHQFKRTRQKPDFSTLLRQYELAKQAGFTRQPILYLDWKVGDHDNPEKYVDKLSRLQEALKLADAQELWIFNKDESSLETLLSSRHTLSAAHGIGAKNIVAVLRANVALALKGLLDIAIIKHNTPKAMISALKENRTIPLAYGTPHAAEERPGTTRTVYGFSLVQKGFAGTLSYAYQSGEPWDDWMKWNTSHYRPNVMAYPTTTTPIPTLQWEAWREAVDDLRYFATYMRMSGQSENEALASLHIAQSDSSSRIRAKLVDSILHSKNSAESSQEQKGT